MTVTQFEQSTPLASGLYIVATPIGNLGDISLRAISILQQCDAVACEDTRVTGKLLHHLGISKPMFRYNDHSDEKERAKLINMAREKALVLVSDAGTPLISDPGYRLVQDMQAEGLPVTSLPGACAAITAMTLSGLPSDRFMFAGFLPQKDKAKEDLLEELGRVNTSLIFYDTAPRLVKSLRLIARLWPTRECAVARELTKLFEECRRSGAAELADYYEAHPPKGEIVLMLGPPVAESAGEGDIDAMLIAAMKVMKTSQAASEVAQMTRQDRRALYARALELREQK